ncbi:jerky protein homolog-like [Anastrepha obliqua]|uniref:jerky protein homolog-like n=1 Tax=Anastrepha obliqua TaxID=95512 RepID=UPI00240A841B|nr:jerky protein homolog-like [Anastrepha obliqua]
MTADIFEEWFHNSFVPEVTTFLMHEGLPVKAVLILDNAPCHLKQKLLKTECGSIFVLYMPPNVTPLLQPMDQNLIRLTKLHYRTNLLKAAIGKDEIADFLKKITLKDAICLLTQAWQKVDADVIKKCWCPLLDYKHPINNDECIEDDVPLSVLRRQIVAQQHSEFEELLNLTETAFPQSNLSVNELRIWTGIDDDCANGTEGVIDDVNQPVEASDEDEDEHDEINGDKCWQKSSTEPAQRVPAGNRYHSSPEIGGT